MCWNKDFTMKDDCHVLFVTWQTGFSCCICLFYGSMFVWIHHVRRQCLLELVLHYYYFLCNLLSWVSIAAQVVIYFNNRGRQYTGHFSFSVPFQMSWQTYSKTRQILNNTYYIALSWTWDILTVYRATNHIKTKLICRSSLIMIHFSIKKSHDTYLI